MKKIKLKNLLNEILQMYQVEVSIVSDRKYGITNILNQVRGLEKVITVNNVTPDTIKQKEKTEETIATIKFVTRDDPKKDLEQFKKDMMTSDLEANDLRIKGILAVYFRDDTLKRLNKVE